VETGCFIVSEDAETQQLIFDILHAELQRRTSACIFWFKMNFASSRFSFTFRYWRSYWSPTAATAE